MLALQGPKPAHLLTSSLLDLASRGAIVVVTQRTTADLAEYERTRLRFNPKAKKINVSVVSTRLNEREGGFTEYEVVVEFGGLRWNVWKRYS